MQPKLYNYGKKSKGRLVTCHESLQILFNTVILYRDCSILEGARSDERQMKLFKAGKSKVDGVTRKSKHQVQRLLADLPSSQAVDVAPYPIPEKWGDHPNPKHLAEFYHFAGIVQGLAFHMGIGLRWGGDWDGDMDIHDQKFDDLVHFELRILELRG